MAENEYHNCMKPLMRELRKEIADFYRDLRKKSPLGARLYWRATQDAQKRMTEELLYGGPVH